jgi:hypothetical protein
VTVATAAAGRLRGMPFLRRALPWALLICLLVCLMVPLLGGVALWLAIEPQPLVTQTPALSPDDIARARQMLARNDPRGKLPGIQRSVVLSQRDLELLANQAGRRLGNPLGSLGELQARVRLQPGLAVIQASLPLAGIGPGGWINLDAVLHQTDTLPSVERLRVGRLPVPGWLAEALLPRLLGALELGAQGELAQRLVSRVTFRSQQAVLVYAWPDDPEQALSNTLLPPAEQQRLKAYAERLAQLSAELSPPGSRPGPVSMTQLLAPVFTLARARSTDAESAARENRAALLALAFLVNGRGLSAILPAAREWPQPQPLAVTLAGRRDTPQHYLVSATLAAEGGGPLADAIGLYKEVQDSRGGSGFSFNDLAADRAGTRLGQLAVRQPQLLQARLAQPLAEADLLPSVADLPEGLPEPEFRRRYGGIDAPAYRRLTDEIEARLDRLPLLTAPR